MHVSGFRGTFSDTTCSLSTTFDNDFSSSFSHVSYCLFFLLLSSLNSSFLYVCNYPFFVKCFLILDILSHPLFIFTHRRSSLPSVVKFSHYFCIRKKIFVKNFFHIFMEFPDFHQCFQMYLTLSHPPLVVTFLRPYRLSYCNLSLFLYSWKLLVSLFCKYAVFIKCIPCFLFYLGHLS